LSNRGGVEALTLIAAVVSALAAVRALVLASETVEETRGLRREERIVRLAEIVGAFGAMAMQIKQVEAGLRNVYPVARMRLEAALAASGETLPSVTALVEMECPSLRASRSRSYRPVSRPRSMR
jgi:hypothetical protein